MSDEPEPAQRIPIEADFIYAYSTTPGLFLCTIIVFIKIVVVVVGVVVVVVVAAAAAAENKENESEKHYCYRQYYYKN